MENLQPEDMIEVNLNGKPVTGWSRHKDNWLHAEIEATRLTRGKNQFGLRLAKQSAGSTKPRRVTALELHTVRD